MIVIQNQQKKKMAKEKFQNQRIKGMVKGRW